MKTILRALAAFLCLFAALSASAQPNDNPLVTKLEARKVVRAADGKETFAPAETAKPGDVIEYVATYRNAGKQALRNLEATLPIPQNTEFVPGSAHPSNARASLDMKTFGQMPLMRRVVKDGKTIEALVPPRDYRSLRWHAGELGGEKTATFTARVRVLDDAPPATAKAAQ
ncbi:MAG TPA: hypothetical protein VFP44_20365 [Usitatibacter sp.]|nr:hypothetical protein [Usitatibacter sp.]